MKILVLGIPIRLLPNVFPLLVFSALTCFSFMNVFTQENGWRKIVPHVTTKAEVEKKIGMPDHNGFYDLEEGRVIINYVTYSCHEKNCHCLAPLNTVQSIAILPTADILIKDLDLDLTVFEKTVTSRNPLRATYANMSSGVFYYTEETRVTKIYYRYSEATCKSAKETHAKAGALRSVVSDQ